MAQPRFLGAAAAAALLILAVAVPGSGTPAGGVLSAPILARGDFAGRVDVKFKLETAQGTIVANAPAAADVVMQEVTIAAGGTTGWHSHPGPVVVIVKTGALTFVQEEMGACTSTVYPAGSAFVDSGQGHVHKAVNETAGNLVLLATYFDVPVGTSPRIDADRDRKSVV